jgi:hypothetical protein
LCLGFNSVIKILDVTCTAGANIGALSRRLKDVF